MKFLTVEGNIGAGKSTLLRKLNDKLTTEVAQRVKILQEPVERFQRYKEFNPLELFYKEKDRNTGFIQLHIIQELKDFFRENIANADESIKLIVSERSPYSPKIFLNVLLKSDFITPFEHAKLNEFADDALKHCTPNCQFGTHHVLYLDESPETCEQRISKCMRGAECDGITRDYLYQLKNEYSAYLDTFAQINGESSITVVPSSSDSDTNATVLPCLTRLIEQLLASVDMENANTSE